jgi:phenylacetate-CoA ligase
MNRSELAALQWAKLLDGLGRILPSNAFYRRKLESAGVVLSDLRGPADLGKLPFTTKNELLADQQDQPPFGTNLSWPLDRYVRIHQTSGTGGRRLRWLDDRANWEWILTLWDEIYAAAGVRRGDRFFFPFSFGPFLGFWAAFEGACRQGYFTMAGGGMTSAARLEAIRDNGVTIVACTPTYALHLADLAEREGVDLPRSAVRMLILAGEPGGSLAAVRTRLESAWGARVVDHSGMTEIGSLGVEFESLPGRLYLLESHCIAEFLAPDSDQPVAEGEVGELVMTNLGRWGSPLIRYRTGDVCRWRFDVHPEGKPFVYLDGGLIGRTDDMLWIKGNNVYPSALESVLRQDASVAEFQFVVDDSSVPSAVTVLVEPRAGEPAAEALSARLEKRFQDQLYFRPAIRVVSPGALPRYEMKSRRIVRKGSKDALP